MRLIKRLSEYSPLDSKITLTLGNFDGVHLGHLSLLKKMQETGGEKLLITFSSHPCKQLFGKAPPLILSHEERLHLLSCWVDTTLVLPFTKRIQEMSAEAFLLSLRKKIPFTTLLLGHDANFGKNREGTPELLHRLAATQGFQLLYLPPTTVDDTLVSSSLIRELIHKGELHKASLYLGRPYALSGIVERGCGLGKGLGTPTLNLSLKGLCHPPLGVWIIRCHFDDRSLYGLANLGTAPTLKNCSAALCEAHLFDFNEPLYGKRVSIEFLSYLREERKFASAQNLKEQIASDLAEAKSYLFSNL